jgi:hypothetical protein
MPEISVFFFDLKQLFRLFPKANKEFDRKIKEYEEQLEEDMAQNRMKLFAE